MTQKPSLRAALIKLFQLINLEKLEIQNVYIYAIVSGIIMLSLPLGIQAIINLMFGATISTSLLVLIALVILATLLNGLLQIKQMRISEFIQQRIFTRLTFAYAYRIPRLKLQSLDNYYLPELVNRFFDTASLQKGLSKLLIDFPAATIQILFGLLLLCFYHPVFIVFGILLCLLVYVMFYFTSPKGFRSSIAESDFKYEVAHWLEEIGRSIKTFKFFQHNDLHLHKTDELVDGYLKSREEHFSVLVFQYRIIIAFKVLITASMLIIGTILFFNQQINLGQFIAADIIILSIMSAIEKMIINLEVVYDVLTSLEKINKVLEKPQDTEEQNKQVLSLANYKGLSLELRAINVGYNSEKLILKNLNLKIDAGEKICLSGIEGSGKSTLIKFLTGMWGEFEGNFLIHQIPFRNLNQDQIYQHIGFFLSDDELFTGTLSENITLNYKNADLFKLQEVCDLVGLTDFITNQPHGFEVKIDPQGRKLSSSIIQKILLARCIYKKPKLLLFEEGWMPKEEQVRERLIKYLTHKDADFTLIAITDDVNFASKCDRHLKMEKGNLI